MGGAVGFKSGLEGGGIEKKIKDQKSNSKIEVSLRDDYLFTQPRAAVLSALSYKRFMILLDFRFQTG